MANQNNLNPDAESHLNGPLFQNALKTFDEAAKVINCDPNIMERLRRPRRCLTVSVPVRMDDQSVKVFTGYRVQYNATLGPYKGGIRYHQNVDMGEVVGLACLMTIKNSLAGNDIIVIINGKRIKKVRIIFYTSPHFIAISIIRSLSNFLNTSVLIYKSFKSI